MIPYAWSMGLSSNTGSPGGQIFVYWNDSGGDSGLDPIFFSGDGLHSGTGAITLTNGFLGGGWISLPFNAYAFANGNLDSQQVTNPIGSIDSFRMDFLPVDEGNEAPEPGTMLLGGTALTLVGLFARRRRRA